MKVDIVVFDGFDELDAIGPFEVFGSARLAGADLDVRLVAGHRCDYVTSTHGLRLPVAGALRPGEADTVVVAGGSWVSRSEVGAWGEVERGDILPVLSAAADGATVTASVCTGGMLLAHAGVIGNRRATTHHAAWDDLAATGATLLKDRVVDDGDLVTAGGVTSGLDLALWLIERWESKELADKLAERLEYDRFRPVVSTQS
jgi:transcriptional regulator GlxA family with amidase domain